MKIIKKSSNFSEKSSKIVERGAQERGPEGRERAGPAGLLRSVSPWSRAFGTVHRWECFHTSGVQQCSVNHSKSILNITEIATKALEKTQTHSCNELCITRTTASLKCPLPAPAPSIGSPDLLHGRGHALAPRVGWTRLWLLPIEVPKSVLHILHCVYNMSCLLRSR